MPPLADELRGNDVMSPPKADDISSKAVAPVRVILVVERERDCQNSIENKRKRKIKQQGE